MFLPLGHRVILPLATTFIQVRILMLNLDYTLEFGALVPIKVEVTQEDSAV
jgi:hypothetical protein